MLPPGEVTTICIGFHAIQPKELTRKFAIEVMDAAEPPVLGVVHTLPVELHAEAYSIDVDVKWPQEGVEGLDFGAFKARCRRRRPPAAAPTRRLSSSADSPALIDSPTLTPRILCSVSPAALSPLLLLLAAASSAHYSIMRPYFA